MSRKLKNISDTERLMLVKLDEINKKLDTIIENMTKNNKEVKDNKDDEELVEELVEEAIEKVETKEDTIKNKGVFKKKRNTKKQ